MTKNKYYIDNRKVNESQFIYEVEENINNYVDAHYYDIINKNFPAYVSGVKSQYIKNLIELSNNIDFEWGLKFGKSDENGILPSVILEGIIENSDEADLYIELYDCVVHYYLTFAQMKTHMKIKNKKDYNITYYTRIY